MDPDDLLGKSLPFSGGLKLESILGYGSFATVYKARNKEGKVFAVKWLNKVGMSDKEQALQKDEVMYMKMLGDHKNIIRLYDVIETSESLFLILEFCTTDLYELITQSEKQLEIPRVKRYFNEICDGVKHCHNNHIYHRDLKPENILLSEDDHCKISDFGLCCFDEWTNDFNCGSLRYMSPECIENEEDEDDDYDDDDDEYDDDSDDNYYGGRRRHEKDGLECNSKGSDVWALGVILINMIFGQNPWSSADMENPTFNMFIRKDPNVLQRKLGLSDEFNRVVKRMFSKNVFDRYSLDELRAEVNRIDVFTDFSKRVSNYLGDVEEYTNTSEMYDNDSQYDQTAGYDDWYQEDIYPDNHVVVPDIDTLELEDEDEKDQEENDQEPTDYSFNYMKSHVPVIKSWGDDFDDEDMELTPRDMEDDHMVGREEEEEEDYTSKMMITSNHTTTTHYDDSDVPMSWENRNETTEFGRTKENKSSETTNKYEFTYEDKMKEWQKEEEEDQMESDDNLTTPTLDKIQSFSKNNLFKTMEMGMGKKNDSKEKPPTLSKKKSVQLRWEDLFSSDEEKNDDGLNSSTIIETSDSPSDHKSQGDRFKISEQALPSSWNYQQGVSWGDMMDDDDDVDVDLVPSKPQPQPQEIMTQPKPTSSTLPSTFLEGQDKNDEGEGDELLFKKEKVPESIEVSTLVTPSLLTNGMMKKKNNLAKKAHKEKKSSLKNKTKGSKDTKDKDKEKDKENRRHHKSRKDKESKDNHKEGIDTVKEKSGNKHKHQRNRTKTSPSSPNEKPFGKSKEKMFKLTDKSPKHRKSKTNLESLTTSNEQLSTVNTLSKSNEPSRKSKNKNKNKNKNNNKHHKHDRKSTNPSPSTKNEKNFPANPITNNTRPRPTSVHLDWEDLFSSDGEERTNHKPESIKINRNSNQEKSFNTDVSMEAEDEVFSHSNHIKALDIENEKGYSNNTSIKKMVDSAISVSETNLSKEIKNLNLH